MKVDNHVSRKIYLTSIFLMVIAVIVGSYAAYREEYIILAAMVFVMVMQVDNILHYRRQKRQNDPTNSTKG